MKNKTYTIKLETIINSSYKVTSFSPYFIADRRANYSREDELAVSQIYLNDMIDRLIEKLKTLKNEKHQISREDLKKIQEAVSTIAKVKKRVSILTRYQSSIKPTSEHIEPVIQSV